MLNFDLTLPTKVVFGKDTEQQAGALVKEFGGSKVLLHYGSESAKKSGLLDRVCASLDEVGIPYVLLGGVVPNPRLSKVKEGIALCQAEGVDFILAVGGGSTIDSAKAIAYGVADGGEVWDFYAGLRPITAAFPVACVLTLAAAGSEMSDSSVITNEDGWYKRGASSKYGRPQFAIMNPELTYTLPPYQTSAGVVDILMHTMERYFSLESMDISLAFCEALMRVVIANGRILMKDPNNYEARAEIMWAGSISHNGLVGAGSSGGDWTTHKIEHELSGKYDVAHGAGLSAIWSTWARYTYKQNMVRFSQFAKNVFNIEHYASIESSCLDGIAFMEAYFREINMPVTIAELGITMTDEDIADMVDKATASGQRTVGALELKGEDVEAILKAAQ